LDLVSDPKTGLFSGISCKFLSHVFENIYNAFCIALVVPLTYLLQMIACASCGMFVLSFLTYYVSMKVSQQKKLKLNKIGDLEKVEYGRVT